jgi:Flp pilus assembly protein TadB
VPGLPLRIALLAIALGFAVLWCVDIAGRALATRFDAETAAFSRGAETERRADELRDPVAAAVARAGSRQFDDATVTLEALAQRHARTIADLERAQSRAHFAYLLAALACVLAMAVVMGCMVYVWRQFVVPIRLLAHVLSVIRDDRNFSRRAGVYGHPAVARVTIELNALLAEVRRDAGETGREFPADSQSRR